MKRLLTTLFLTGLCVSALAASKPNVLFIGVDDLKPMLGCYGDQDVLSPNMDKLAAQGMVFLNNACQQSVCGPSRASLMTGCYPDTTKVYDLKTKMRDVNPDILSLPQYFRQQGYVTTGVGKIFDKRCVDELSDEASWSIPFVKTAPDRYFASTVGRPTEYSILSTDGPFRDFHVKDTKEELKKFKAYLNANGISKKDRQEYRKTLQKFPLARPITEALDLPDDAYQDGAFVNCALEQMETLAKGDKPFFLAVGFKKPHLPFVAPKKYWDLYDRSKIKLAVFQKMPEDAPDFSFQDSWELRNYSNVPFSGPVPKDLQRELIHGYRACTSYIDAQVGKLLEKLENLGLAENTIVVLWGDHGWHLGDHGMFCKHSNFEQAVRSPLIISAPSKKIKKGAKTESPTEFVDLFPTLCDLAGLPVPSCVEGLSLVPILENPQAMIHEAALEQYPRDNRLMGYTLRDKRYRYIKWVVMDYLNGEGFGPMEANELYDYEKDPLETVNLAGNPEYKSIIENFERIFKKRGIAQEK